MGILETFCPANACQALRLCPAQDSAPNKSPGELGGRASQEIAPPIEVAFRWHVSMVRRRGSPGPSETHPAVPEGWTVGLNGAVRSNFDSRSAPCPWLEQVSAVPSALELLDQGAELRVGRIQRGKLPGVPKRRVLIAPRPRKGKQCHEHVPVGGMLAMHAVQDRSRLVRGAGRVQ